MSAPAAPPPLSAMRSVHVRVILPTLCTLASIELTGPRNIVDLLVAAIGPAASRWPHSVVITERQL